MKSCINLLTLLLPLFRGVLGTAVYTNWMYSLSSNPLLGPVLVFKCSWQLYDCSNRCFLANPATNFSAFLPQFTASPASITITVCRCSPHLSCTSLPKHSALLLSLVSPLAFCNLPCSAELLLASSFSQIVKKKIQGNYTVGLKLGN